MGIFRRKNKFGVFAGPWFIQYPHRKDPITGRTIYTTRCAGHSKRVADRLLAKKMLEWERIKLLGQDQSFKDLSVSEILDWYIGLPSTKEKRSYDRDQSRAERLKEMAGTARVSLLKPENIQALQQKLLKTTYRGRVLKPATVNRHIALLKTAFNLAFKNRLIATNPLKGAKMLKEDNRIGRAITPREFQRLLSHLPEHIANVVKVAYMTGMRSNEVLALRWRDVDIEYGVLELSGEMTKNGEAREVPLPQALLKLLGDLRPQEFQPEDPVFTHEGVPIKSVRWHFIKACERAGLKGLRFHDLRHTFVTNARKAGLDRKVIKTISGHKTDSMFERYSHIDGEDLKNAAEVIEKYQNGHSEEA
jgi:integrase